jgi:hypothetical protein
MMTEFSDAGLAAALILCGCGLVLLLAIADNGDRAFRRR